MRMVGLGPGQQSERRVSDTSLKPTAITVFTDAAAYLLLAILARDDVPISSLVTLLLANLI